MRYFSVSTWDPPLGSWYRFALVLSQNPLDAWLPQGPRSKPANHLSGWGCLENITEGFGQVLEDGSRLKAITRAVLNYGVFAHCPGTVAPSPKKHCICGAASQVTAHPSVLVTSSIFRFAPTMELPSPARCLFWPQEANPAARWAVLSPNQIDQLVKACTFPEEQGDRFVIHTASLPSTKRPTACDCGGAPAFARCGMRQSGAGLYL